MKFCFSILVPAVAALSSATATAQQSWRLPAQQRGVETAQDEQGHQVRAFQGSVLDATTLPPAPLVSNWQALGPYGGDIDDVQVSPINSNIVLAGLAPASLSGGGMYRSTDGGTTWSTVPTLDGKVVHDIAFAPDGTAYAGTIDGVWKSTNSGSSFTNLPLGIGLNDQVYDIDVDPSNPLRLWIGVADALGSQPINVMLSPDGGATWQNKTPLIGSALSCGAVAIDPTNSNRVFAGFKGFTGGGQVWVTTDGGTIWNNRSAGLPNRPVNDIVHDGTRALVGGGQLFGSQTFGLFSSPDDGVTWTPLHNGSWTNLVVHDIAIDPNAVNTIYAATAGAGLFRSTDGGTVWSIGVGGTGSLSVNAVSFAPGSSSTIFTGSSSNAVWRSTDSGANFAASSIGIGALDVYSIDSNPLNASELAIAFQGLNDGGVFTSTNAGATWSLAALPGTRFNQVRFSPAGVLYAISDGPTTIGAEALYRRVGSVWNPIGPNQGPLFESELFGMRVSANDPNFIVAVGADFGVAGFEPTVWRTTDGGAIWTKVYEGVVTNKPLQDLLVVDPGADTTWLAPYVDYNGGGAGGVLRSSDSAVTWAASNTGLPAQFIGYSIADTTPSGTIFVSNAWSPSSNGLARSVDGGLTWNPTAFVGQAYEVATDPYDANTVYIAQYGAVRVSASIDAGNSFTPFNTGLSTNEGPRDLQRATGAGSDLLLAASKGSYSTDLIPPYVPFCFGDGTGTACPCFNSGSPGNGCASSAFASGALISGTGVAGASPGTDSLVLTASSIPGPGLFFQGTVAGLGFAFGDGLLCMGGVLTRMGVVFPTGSSASYPGGLTPNPIHVAGGPISSGDVKHYQCWYRDSPVFCTTATFNLTQGLTVVWGP